MMLVIGYRLEFKIKLHGMILGKVYGNKKAGVKTFKVVMDLHVCWKE